MTATSTLTQLLNYDTRLCRTSTVYVLSKGHSLSASNYKLATMGVVLVLCVCPDPAMFFVFVQIQQFFCVQVQQCSLCSDPSTVFFVFVQIHQRCSLCLSRSINNVLCVCPDSLTVLFVFVQAQQCSFCLSRSIKNECSLCLCRSNKVDSVCPDPSKMNALCVCAGPTMFILFVQIHQK